MKFWTWFLRGLHGRAGFLKYLDPWSFLHITVGVMLSLIVPATMQEASNTFLLPLAAIFIGLSFAWGGNAQALLQTEEIETLASYHTGGLEEYVYTFQAAILVILVTLTLWGLAGLGVFDKAWPTPGRPELYFAVESMLFVMASVTVRECWHVVLGAQWMLLARHQIRKHRETGKKPPDSPTEG